MKTYKVMIKTETDEARVLRGGFRNKRRAEEWAYNHEAQFPDARLYVEPEAVRMMFPGLHGRARMGEPDEAD